MRSALFLRAQEWCGRRRRRCSSFAHRLPTQAQHRQQSEYRARRSRCEVRSASQLIASWSGAQQQASRASRAQIDGTARIMIASGIWFAVWRSVRLQIMQVAFTHISVCARCLSCRTSGAHYTRRYTYASVRSRTMREQVNMPRGHYLENLHIKHFLAGAHSESWLACV